MNMKGITMERKLASIQTISEIKNIEGADLIQAYKVLGWWVVDQKDAHQVGDKVVYCEIDSWIPHAHAPFLSKGKDPREYNGIKGERLRSVKLRGQISQGLLLSLNTWAPNKRPWTIAEEEFAEGADLTDYLGIQKFEPQICLGWLLVVSLHI